MINSIPVTNSFSWRRFMAVARFYYPRLRIQLLVYPLIAVFFSICIAIATNYESFELLTAPLVMAINAMISFGPRVFACRKGLETETLLPATATEKCTFILIYGLVVIPLLVLLPMLLMYFILPVDRSLEYIIQLISKSQNMFISKTYGLSLIQYCAPAITCLWSVMALKNNRVVMGIVWTFVYNTVLGIAGGIYGAYMAFKIGFKDGMDGVSKIDTAALTNRIIDDMAPYMTIVSVVVLIYCIFALYKTCQSIKNRQM